MDRPRRNRAPVRALRDGPHGAEHRRAANERGSQADQLAAALDSRHLRIHGSRLADHDGQPRRSNRPPQAADDRRRRVRGHFRGGCILDQPRDADRGACPARRRGGDSGAVDTLADPSHVPRSSAAHICHRRLGNELFDRRDHRSAAGRCSAGVFLVGLGISVGRPCYGAVAAGRPETVAGVP